MAPSRARRRSGRRLFGSRRMANRSSSRRAMSRTDRDRTRDAASSIASGSPSRDSADLGHRGGGRRVERELAAQFLGSADEQGDRLLPGQRLELVLMLTVQTESRLAGGEHPQLRQGVEQRLHQRGHAVEQMFAVVQQQDGPGPREPLPERRLTAGDLEASATITSVSAALGIESVQPDEPHPARRAEPVGNLQGEPGLADPARTDHRHQAVRGHGGEHRRDVLLPADGRCFHRRQVPRGARAAGLQLGAVLQNLLVQRLQAHPRIDAELVGQQIAAPPRTPTAPRPAGRPDRAP